MDVKWFVFLSLSIIIGTLLGWWRFKKIPPTWYPFIFLLTIGSLNELLSYWLTANHHSISVNNNIYVLLEALLTLWLFYNWQIFPFRKYLFIGLFSAIIAAWLAENILRQGIYSISYYFRLSYAVLIIIFSILINSRLIITYRFSLLRNPVFLVCAAYILFFTYKILVEIFWLYGINASRAFRVNVYTVLAWINCFTNLIYAMAILCIPSKQPYSMLSW